MKRPEFLIIVVFGACMVLAGFAVGRDWPRTPKPTPRPVSPAPRASAPIQVNVYVYRAQDVETVLQAAKRALPQMEGAEGLQRQ